MVVCLDVKIKNIVVDVVDIVVDDDGDDGGCGGGGGVKMVQVFKDDDDDAIKLRGYNNIHVRIYSMWW